MTGVETILLVSSLTSCGIIYSSVLINEFIRLINNDFGSLKAKILLGLVLPFYPIWVPPLLLHEYLCYRPRETSNVETRNGYDGFQERTNNIVNEDNNTSNTNEN